MKNNKDITIDGLARMVQKGFSDMEEDFDGINNRIGKLEKGQQLILKRLEGVVYRTEFEKLQTRVVELEELLAIPPKKIKNP